MQHRLLRRALCLSALGWPAVRAIAQGNIDLAALRERLLGH